MSVTISTSQAAFLFRRIDCFAKVDPHAWASRFSVHAKMK
jgi:hypothetical protein